MKKNILCAVIAAGLILTGASSARAGILDWLFGKKEAAPVAAPEYWIHDDAGFDANTSVVHMRPKNNPALEFDIRLPKNWTSEDLTKNAVPTAATPALQDTEQHLMGDIAAIKSEMIGVNRINISVTSQTIKQEVSAQNWLKHYIFANGYALEGEVTANGPRQAAAHYSSIRDQISLFTYIVVRFTGNIAILTRAEVPLPIKEFTKYIQEKVPNSLQISYLKDQGVEATKSFALVDAARFNYPVSWQPVNSDFKDMTHLSVQLVSKDQDGTINGFIRIAGIRRTPETNLMKEVDLLKRHFSEFMGMDIRSLVSSAKVEKPNGRFMFSRQEVYAVAYKKENMIDPEVRLAVLGDKEWYFFIYLISPREQDNLEIWSNNVRVMDIVTETLR